MLTITVVENKDILEKCSVAEATILMCSDDGVEKGYVAFVQNGYILDVVGFEVYYCDEELSGESYIIADTLVKSLGSYALNHSCFYLQSSKKELFSILNKFSFTYSDDDKIKTNLQQLFKVCKN